MRSICATTVYQDAALELTGRAINYANDATVIYDGMVRLHFDILEASPSLDFPFSGEYHTLRVEYLV